jgi:hypothetical protein
VGEIHGRGNRRRAVALLCYNDGEVAAGTLATLRAQARERLERLGVEADADLAVEQRNRRGDGAVGTDLESRQQKVRAIRAGKAKGQTLLQKSNRIRNVRLPPLRSRS